MGSEATSFPGLTLRKINVKPNNAKASSSPPAEAEVAVPEEEPVTPAGRLFMEPDMNCYILCTLAFQNAINVAEFKQTLLVTLANHKRFQSVIRKDRKGKDVWVLVEVDINAHIVEPPVDTSAPGFLENYITDLSIAPPLDITRPMWQCHILNGPSGQGDGQPAANMVVRVHHALGDGTSLMSLLLACTRRLGHPEELPAVPVARRKDRESKSILRTALDMLALVWNTVVGVFLFMATALCLKDSESLIKGHIGVEKEKKKLVVVTLSLSDMVVVKNAVNGTINDVLMAIVGEGLLHYLEGRYSNLGLAAKPAGEVETTTGEMNAEVVKSKKLPSKVEKMRIRACALMNTRGSPGLQELASMMEGGSQTRWGNHMGYLLIDIPLKFHQDPLDYVRAAKKTTDRKKASMEGIYTYVSGAALMNLTGPVPPTILTRRVILQTTLAISNVPGPTEPVTFAGNPIVGIYPTVSGHPQSVSIYLQTYDGKASLVIMSAESAMPDPDVFARLCVDSLTGMVNAAKAAGPESAGGQKLAGRAGR